MSTPPEIPVYRETRLRSVIKAISWRCVGTLDTFCVSFVVLTFTGVTDGNRVQALQLSSGIAGVEVMTKILLFYLHERAWMRVSLGRTRL
ncbi:MAG: DUF2061 domain-containing protein [Verrucomicrobiota bacterium]